MYNFYEPIIKSMTQFHEPMTARLANFQNPYTMPQMTKREWPGWTISSRPHPNGASGIGMNRMRGHFARYLANPRTGRTDRPR